MEFGMFHEFQRLPGSSEASSFANSLAQVDEAERLGLDAMWLAELHFAPERSVLASPLIIAATIAQRTRRMKIGTAVQVLPLCHPLRLAEEVATVDQLSGGRLIFGVGRSGFAHTYATYGVDYGESRERFAEVMTGQRDYSAEELDSELPDLRRTLAALGAAEEQELGADQFLELLRQKARQLTGAVLAGEGANLVARPELA